VDNLLKQLRKTGKMAGLRQGVEIISEFVREACGFIVTREFLDREKYTSGDVRQVFYHDLLGLSEIGTVEHVERKPKTATHIRKWVEYGRDEIRSTLSMYGDNFLFPQRIILEDGGLGEGKLGFCTIVVPTPEENSIMRDHFVGMPLFGGHLQMEAVAQFGTFVILKSLEGRSMLPILTGTVFPDLNTMAPPGEKLTLMGEVYVPDKRLLEFRACIENRFARSEGLIKGMLVTDRVLRKMLSSFFPNRVQD
jgi:3-hydroxymyristoyl/3-hydroxydecanoyl-(acyl carrier protein) dehydratase